MQRIRVGQLLICATVLWNMACAEAYAQGINNIVINQGGVNTQSPSASGEIFINGISSKEDVGGVEICRGKYRGYAQYDVYLKNYNNFPVSVVYRVHVSEGDEYVAKTASIVLQSNEARYTGETYLNPQDFRIIARRMETGATASDSGNNTSASSAQENTLIKYGGYFYLYPHFVYDTKPAISDFINTLNSKNVYGHRNWRLATPSEADIVKENRTERPIGTVESEARVKNHYTGEYYFEKYHFVIVCE